jgi:hypothetical protein
VKLIHDGYSSVGPFVATKPAQSCFASNEQEEDVQAADEIDLKRPICTTPGDFKSFEKWASILQFKTIVETYEPPANSPSPFPRKWLTWV